MIRLIYLTPPQSKNLRVCIQMYYTTSPPPPLFLWTVRHTIKENLLFGRGSRLHILLVKSDQVDLISHIKQCDVFYALNLVKTCCPKLNTGKTRVVYAWEKPFWFASARIGLFTCVTSLGYPCAFFN